MSAIVPGDDRKGLRMRRLHVALVLLSFGAGAADAFAFLALSGTFTANMTGNLVLAAMFTRPAYLTTLLCALVAIAAFALVLYSGFRWTKNAGSAAASKRMSIRQLLVPSLLAQAVVVVLWLVVWQHLPLPVEFVVIALSAGALALQTVAAKKLTDIDGITTTYVTGTLTTTMQALAERSDRGQGIRVLSILALPAGAVACTALLHLVPWAGPVLPFVITGVATAIAFAAEPPASTPAPAPVGTPGA